MKSSMKCLGRLRIPVFAVLAGLAVGVAMPTDVAAATSAKPPGPTPAPALQGRVIADADGFAVLSRRARIEPENRILVERLETLLPRLMTETQLDMWLV
ncbi:MAG: hypothetical protein EBU76_08465, partial [Gammaproteobacteria bacterium]|nr:hypothetical protein [Gammaproteobacteria bacterium]